jgi:hypothetical protein
MAMQTKAAPCIWRLIHLTMSAMLIYLIIFVNESVYWKQMQVKPNEDQEN